MKVAILGTGLMGYGMAEVLAGTDGIELTAWNRSRDKAAPLADAGAAVADDPASAVAGAEVVITMLFDTDAVLDVMERARPSLPDGVVWLQTSTVGLEGSDRIAAWAAEHGVALLDAPVLGTKKPAAEGALVVLASGDPALADRARPVLDAIGSRTVWVGDRPGPASALKLAANAWVLTLTTGTAQSIALAQALGLDGRLFLDAIQGTATDSPYAHVKGGAILSGDFTASFPVEGGLKDLGLIRAAAEGRIDAGVVDAVRGAFQRAADGGHGDDDLAGVYHGLTRGEG
ncbi:3-hydroxyisobutyrate dehydrogenase [Friedmanniella endophytica]|uniref:3-hydroxyisobutyrate dehydrogenase n=1 Tax=Microlunatus kandeliicorticis TaxID=1759536 RepID=A0A7W3P770_9ACTN|nr:NAD(P)-dependent oxidoreductase [Microlunatus kandeliicorticis]MBA8795719.1 3-hydroxyisobutyrate dehydrogenase [Microlunatus kandeliicorticis]